VSEVEGLDEGRFVTRKQLLVRGGALALSTSAASILMSACGSGSSGSSGGGTPVGLSTAPTTPFDPNVKPGVKPDLPRRLAWSLPSGGELFTTFDHSVREAVKNNDIEYISAQANGDSAKQVQQTQAFLARGVGALFAVDLAPPALASLQQQAIDRGIAVFCGPFAPSTVQVAWDEYARGKAQAESAVKWVNENLGGKAEVGNLVITNAPHLKGRFQAIHDVLGKYPDIKIVAEIGGGVDADTGKRLTDTILQKHPNVNVWLGADSVLAGTLSSLEAAGKDDENVGLFGIDGGTEALAEIAKGGVYKTTQASPYSVVAYAMAAWAGDWLDGRSIPLLLKIGQVQIDSKETVDAFNKTNEDPGAAAAENEKTFRYFRPLGNTSYEHNRYIKRVVQLS
jgi:ribose transport system substrate-binding protein